MCYFEALSRKKGMRMVDFPEGFDLTALLEPIPGDAPQGVDIREDFSSQSPYNRLRDARSDARDAEKMLDNGDPNAADPSPMWRTVREIGLKTLKESTKDLEVAAWVTEAYVRSHGLAGLAAGASLIKGLTDQYWDSVFPLPDDYGVETRVAPITGLNGRDGGGSLIQPLYKIPFFDRPDGTPVTFFSYQSSEQLPALTNERRDARIKAGAVPWDDMEKEARTVGAPRLGRLRDEATAALEAWEAMATTLDEKASEDPPSTSHVRDMLRQIHTATIRYAPAPEAAAEAAGGEAAAEGGEAGGGQGGVPGIGGFSANAQRTVSREDALRTLETIATFFRKTEPVSPLAYTLDDAIRRAKLSWPELLEEVVPDANTRQAILNSLGIRPVPEG
jgi:type VI secretion system protein ImpA